MTFLFKKRDHEEDPEEEIQEEPPVRVAVVELPDISVGYMLRFTLNLFLATLTLAALLFGPILIVALLFRLILGN